MFMRKLTTIVFLFFSLLLQGQIEENWNLDIDTYTHNSSNYSSNNPPIEIALLSNAEMIILTQNGTLAKVNSSGKLVWEKPVSKCSEQRIISDNNDHFYVSCENLIKKFDFHGNLIWKRDYSDIFNKDYLAVAALTIHEDTLFVVGSFYYSRSFFLLSTDLNGKVLWKKKFKQKEKYNFEFIPPQEITIKDGYIYVLANTFAKSESYIYSTKIDGTKLKEKKFYFTIKKLKIHNNLIYVIGHLDNLKDRLIIGEIDAHLNFNKISDFELPRNMIYEKAIRSFSSIPPPKDEFEKEYITSYEIGDVEFIDENNLLIVGTSYGKPWLINLNTIQGINWNLEITDNRYFQFNNVSTIQYYKLNTIKYINNKFLVTGISEEEDYREAGFLYFINLFLREIKIVGE